MAPPRPNVQPFKANSGSHQGSEYIGSTLERAAATRKQQKSPQMVEAAIAQLHACAVWLLHFSSSGQQCVIGQLSAAQLHAQTTARSTSTVGTNLDVNQDCYSVGYQMWVAVQIIPKHSDAACVESLHASKRIRIESCPPKQQPALIITRQKMITT
jgi:hypothetical protein